MTSPDESTRSLSDDSGNSYAAVSNGGIWKSSDQQHWTSIGDGLPTQVVSGIAWTSAGGGTLIVLTGDLAYGGDTYAGLGVYRSADGGATLDAQHRGARRRARLQAGRRSDRPDEGLRGHRWWPLPLHRRRRDSFANVNLPTGANAPSGTPDCTGQPPTVKNCFLANMVTDVVVQGRRKRAERGRPSRRRDGGGRLARRQQANADGAQQSPGKRDLRL